MRRENLWFGMSKIAISAVIALISITLAWAGSKEKTLYSFQDLPDGDEPFARVTLRNGRLFGTTVLGGDHDSGIVYELKHTKSGWQKTTLHSFTGGSDGKYPWAEGLLDKVGNLYGTTANGGTGPGTVFELSLHSDGSWTETVLHSFSGPDGGGPIGGLTWDDSGNLYGTTAGGGSGYGTIFRLSPIESGWKLTTLHEFDGKDGWAPSSTLLRDDRGNLYGTTQGGGGRGCKTSDGCGTVFELSPSGGRWKFTTLYRFAGGPDGLGPGLGRLAMDKAGTLYGTTDQGGIHQFGVVYKLERTGRVWRETVLHSFSGYPSDGDNAAAGVILDSKGNMYGTTLFGGTYNGGTVFKVAQSRRNVRESVLFSFDGSNGFEPMVG